MSKIRRYSELRTIDNFRDRYLYLKLSGQVGESTFGYERYLNQYLYRSSKWRSVRNEIIIRDNGCDLGHEDFGIHYPKIIIHHMNPVTQEQIENDDDILYDPEFLICTSPKTHNAIHFGDEKLLPELPTERRPGDTCPWKR